MAWSLPMFEASVAKLRVDPQPGMRLAGFAARKGVCQGVHDSLYVRSLVLANGADAAAIVAVDVLALPAGFVDRARQGIVSKTGIPPAAVMIACTHTHAAPVTMTTFFN